MEDKKSEQEISLVEITTQTDLAYKLPDGRIVDMREYLVWIGNLVYKIQKSLG